MVLRVPPSGYFIPLGFAGPVFQRQNPDAAQVVGAGTSVVVLAKTVPCPAGAALCIMAEAHGQNQEPEAGAGNFTITVRVTPQTVPPTPPILLDIATDVLVGPAQTGEMGIDTAYVPADIADDDDVLVELVVTATSEAFDVGTRPAGGCSLLIVTCDRSAFEFVIATP